MTAPDPTPDIVERLRAVADHIEAEDNEDQPEYTIMVALQRDAIAEIERLRAALREVQDIIDAHPMPSQRLVNAVAIIEAALAGKGES